MTPWLLVGNAGVTLHVPVQGFYRVPHSPFPTKNQGGFEVLGFGVRV